MGQWGLEAGDKLEWSWEARDNEMILVVRKVTREMSSRTRSVAAAPRRK